MHEMKGRKSSLTSLLYGSISFADEMSMFSSSSSSKNLMVTDFSVARNFVPCTVEEEGQRGMVTHEAALF